jgi:hypothetical protein
VWWWVALSVVFVALPVALCAVWPHTFRSFLALGASLAGVEWLLAYRSNQVDYGGDWQRGGELLAYTGFFAVIFFLIWLTFALLGRVVGLRHARGT